jgi:hypothetical protein
LRTFSFKRDKASPMYIIKKWSFLFVFLFPLSSIAQVGVSVGGTINNAAGWVITDLNNNTKYDLPGNSYFLSLNYEFSSKNYRIAIVPEIGGALFKNEFVDLGIFTNKTIRFQLNTHIYFLDFKGDCDCPTFSKKGSPLKKGLFFNISPGISYFANTVNPFTSPTTDHFFKPNIGAGLGYDIGLTKNITLTTFTNAYIFPRITWPGLINLLSIPSTGNKTADGETNLTQIQAGIALRYHF